MFGSAVSVLVRRWRELVEENDQARTWVGATALGLVVAAAVVQFVLSLDARVLFAFVAVAAVAAALLLRYRQPAPASVSSSVQRPASSVRILAPTLGVLATLVVLAYASGARQVAREMNQTMYVPVYDAAMKFKPLIAPGVPIAVSSEQCTPREESASNMPWFLYWTDHYGFDLCSDSQTVEGLEHLRARGARYFIEDHEMSVRSPSFDPALRKLYPVLSETPRAVLFDLRKNGGR
jgi:hypothetical protein